EDGIRDRNVTGVQTCALPISVIDVPQAGQDVPLSALSYKAKAFEAKLSTVRLDWKSEADPRVGDWTFLGSNTDGQMHRLEVWLRSEERRVGKRRGITIRERRT